MITAWGRALCLAGGGRAPCGRSGLVLAGWRAVGALPGGPVLRLQLLGFVELRREPCEDLGHVLEGGLDRLPRRRDRVEERLHALGQRGGGLGGDEGPVLVRISGAGSVDRSDGRRLDIYKANFKPLKHTLSGSTERVLMKLVVDRDSQVVLGVHMVGADAAEIIQSIAIAVKMGATKSQFDQTVALHPTAAEEFVTMRTPEPEPVEPALQAAGE